MRRRGVPEGARISAPLKIEHPMQTPEHTTLMPKSAHESDRLCVGGHENRPAAHFNTIYRQFCLNSPSLHLRAADSYLIPNRRKEETTSAEHLCIVAVDTSQTGVFVEDRMDLSGQGKAGY